LLYSEKMGLRAAARWCRLLWLVSPEADGMTGRRLVATKWQAGGDGKSPAEPATEQAGW
jgi:hypothetical protein